MSVNKHQNVYLHFFIQDKIVDERLVLWTYQRMIEKTKEEFKNNSNKKIDKK